MTMEIDPRENDIEFTVAPYQYEPILVATDTECEDRTTSEDESENDDAAGNEVQVCITEHEGFQVNCLNRHVQELSFYEYLDNSGPIGDEEPVHELYRYIAYRLFVRWVWHRLGKKNRKVLPSCVVQKIRETFPSQEYTGFQYPRDY